MFSEATNEAFAVIGREGPSGVGELLREAFGAEPFPEFPDPCRRCGGRVFHTSACPTTAAQVQAKTRAEGRGSGRRDER